MIFVDTSGWFASAVPTDADHHAASEWLAACGEPLITTDYVIDKTLTLLRARGENSRAAAMGEALFSEELARIHYLDEADIQGAWTIFRDYRDKQWSFTDCSSKFVTERLGVTRAFSFDRHFHQFGTVEVLPA